MITKGLIDRVYSAASIQRWNDHARPVEFTELDKQAHKMIIAYVIAKFEEDTETKNPVDWPALIEGGIFEFLHRITLTDLKPAVFHELMTREREKLNHWVLEQLEGEIRDIGRGFRDRFSRYLSDPAYSRREKRILKAAHYMATNWEFKIIYNVSPFIYGIEKTKQEIENQIEDHYDLIGVQKLSLGKKSYGFIDLCGQLRFQQRWAQSPRLPKTSVLGHLLVVATLSYLASMELGFSGKRVYNNFYSALFHDLPEVLTKDIVHPIKRSIEGLEKIIRNYERKQLEEKILPLLPVPWHREITFFVENEFDNRILRGGQAEKVAAIGEDISGDEFSPVDGKIIEICDKFAAYVEVCLSMDLGICPKNFEQAKEKLYRDYHGADIYGFPFGTLFDHYREG